MSGRGAYDVLLEQQQTHSTYQEYLQDHKEEKLQQAIALLDHHLNAIIDFEQEIGDRKEKYLKSKEKTKANINNNNIKNIRQDINKQHSQEIKRFFNFCDREIENYLKIISSEIKDYPDIVQNINHKIVDSMEQDNIIQHHFNHKAQDK